MPGLGILCILTIRDDSFSEATQQQVSNVCHKNIMFIFLSLLTLEGLILLEKGERGDMSLHFRVFVFFCNNLMTRGEKGEGGDAGFCPGLSGPDLLLLRMQIRF